MSKEIAEEYASSLADLTVNSKPLINMLTILAEENIDHAGVIVETVEKHLEKVQPEIKLPVLYLVDSIIKNVGGAYTQKFSQSIVNMFQRTFKQVDEKIRSQMFKLRETWHDVFPATKLYQLDVKVNLIDPAWPIQAQPHQSNIHVNPNFLKKTATSSAAPPPTTEEEEKMRSILAKKEQELLMLQRKKIEMELEQTKRQLEMAEKTVKRGPNSEQGVPLAAMPIAMVNPVVAPVLPLPAELPNLSAKQRLGPPVNKVSGGRIAPVSGALASARRDPRLARLQPPAPPAAPGPAQPPIAPNVFDIKPLERVTKRKNVITIDVRPERRDPRLDKRRERPRLKRPEQDRKPADRALDTDYIDKIVPDTKKINKLPPIPKINRETNNVPAPAKKRKEVRDKKKRREDPSPEKKAKVKEVKEAREKERRRREAESDRPSEPAEPEPVAFKELKNYHKERYMRRNRDQSDSPECNSAAPEPPNVPELVLSESKDVDLRVLQPVVDPAPAPALVTQKRPSTEAAEGKPKKNKVDRFDILFGNEDVDLRQLPQVDEVSAPPPPSISESPKTKDAEEYNDDVDMSPQSSPKKDWTEVKDKDKDKEVKKAPSKLELVRAKLAEATKGKDRLGRPLLFCKSPSIEKERRRSLSTEDTDLRAENPEDFDATDHKKTISIIMSQAKEQFNDGTLNKDQYNTLMYQVLQLNEKLKLKEAKQRESLEMSKRKLKAHIDENNKVSSPKSSPKERNTFGDIDERITPAMFVDTPPNSQNNMQDSDMRMDALDGPMIKGPPPMPPMMMFGPYHPMWRGPRPRNDEYMPRRFRGPAPFFRAKFDKRGMRPPFEPRMPLLPTPLIGMCQGECPLKPYERCESPLPLGVAGFAIPPTDYKILEYIDQDPVKTIQIDGIPREIRFYGETAVIMLDWDDPREIKFLPGCRRITFDNKDSVVLSFNEGYKQIEIDDQTFDIRFGAPTRELYINGRWYECFFGGQPLGVIIDGKPRLLHLEGPLPQVDIGKVKRTDLVAGKINLIVNATQMCPVYLDAKVQKFMINGQYFTIRFADALRTVLINEQPFKVEFGDLPKPIFIGNEKYFVRFSALPRNIRPGLVRIENMEGDSAPAVAAIANNVGHVKDSDSMEVDQKLSVDKPIKTPSPEMNIEHQGLNMLASVMPSSMDLSMTPASGSEYSVAEPLFVKPESIPGLDTPAEEKPALPLLGNINVNDLFAKLVATGIVQVPNVLKSESKEEPKVEEKPKPIEDKSVVHKVDLLKSDTLKVKQASLVSRLYGGMQCSGCGARFPPEHTVRYSQHLDWHFRQNRRERDSARRAHSRHWHYDLADWLQYEELEDLDEREKSWFETGAEAGAGAGAGAEAGAAPAPSVAAGGAPEAQACALCGDPFLQFYNEDHEEWHLRNSVRHDDRNYHPDCFEEYKASLTKEETPKEEATDEVTDVEKMEEAIEIKDVDDTLDQSDNESVVEVVEPEVKDSEPVEIDEEGEEDDVVLKAEPVEEVVVEEADTDDETCEERSQRDRQAKIDFASVKIKQEPLDPDDEPIITMEEEAAPRVLEPSPAGGGVVSSIDGNTQLSAAPPAAAPGGIRINISKALPSFVTNNHDDKMLEDISADDEPLPPGEEPELVYTLKPSLEGVQLSRQPPVVRGNELSGLCSIM